MRGKSVQTTNIYFITYKDGPIKIGMAGDVRKRLGALQTSHHQSLQVMGVIPGKPSLETVLHRKFEHLRLRGEWFRRDNEILDYIQKNRDTNTYPNVMQIRPIVKVHPENGPFGPVQVISGEHAGKYGYYDDDETEVDECDFCLEASERGALDAEYECPDCIVNSYAIVYFDKFVGGGYYLLDYDELRVVDEEAEEKQHDDVIYNLWPGLREEHRVLVDDGMIEESKEDMVWEGAPANG